MGKAIGIDLGTTNSAIAIIQDGRPVVLPNAEGAHTTPSVVAYRKTGERLVGLIARRQAVLEPERTIHSAKRFIGRPWEESIREAEGAPYRVVEGPGGSVRFAVNGGLISPEEVSAQIIRKLVDDASRALGEEIGRAVITVPAYFNDSQRQATRNAGRIAGLEVLRVVSEPTAAALAYGLDRKRLETVMVFDLGGGTFDVSILEVGNGVCEVRATSGDAHLGGDDFDRRIVEWLATGFRGSHGFDPRRDPQAHQRMYEAAEKAKCELSSVSRADISLPFLTGDTGGPIHFTETLTRDFFEEMIADLLARCRGPMMQALADAGVSVAELDEIILVGGSTRIPAVQRMVKEVLGGREPRMRMNPDEVVAMGAAVQAGVLTGEVGAFVLLDVLPLSLGVETVGGVMERLVERNTPIPARRTEIFTTAKDMQDSVEIVVLQGEREMARDNRRLGRFRLEGIRPAPRGVPEIEVTFDVDADGILRVMAADRDTGLSHAVTVRGTTRLDEGEIQRMIRESEANASADQRRRRAVHLRNEARTCVYHFRRTAQVLGPVIPVRERRRGDQLVRDLLRAVERETSADHVRQLMHDIEHMVRTLTAMSGDESGAQQGRSSRKHSSGAESGRKRNDHGI